MSTRYWCSDGFCGGDDCGKCNPCNVLNDDVEFENEKEESDDVVTDASASGLINDSIDRCFEASLKC